MHDKKNKQPRGIMPLGCFSLFYWYADCKHITPHHNRKIITAVVFDCVRDGGDEESRTPVRKHFRKNFSERSRWFEFREARRPAAGLRLRYPVVPLCFREQAQSFPV